MAKQTTAPPIIWSVREIAEAFGAHPQTVRRWARSGIFPGVKAGNRNHKLWFTSAALRAFVDTRPGIRWMGRALR